MVFCPILPPSDLSNLTTLFLSSRSRHMFLRRLTSFLYSCSPPGGTPSLEPLKNIQNHSGAFRLLDTHSWTCKPEQRLRFLALPQRTLHLSSGLMEEKEPPHKQPPHKRWKSSEDRGSRDSGARDSGPRDRGARDSGARDSGARDSGARDSGARDSGPRDSGARDSGARDSGARDRGARDSGSRDRGARDSGSRDRGARDSGARDSGSRDSGSRDRGARDSGARDSGPRDSGPRDSGSRDSGPRDRGSRDSSELRLPKTDKPLYTLSSTTRPNYWFKNGAKREPPPPGVSPSSGPQPPGPKIPTILVAPLYRPWEEFSSFYKPQQSPNQKRCEFSVLTYNILSQDLLHDNAYLYRHCTDSVLSWTFRLPNLLRELQLYNADILCLQEVQQNHYEEQIRPALQARGYWCEYKCRTGGKTDGCAVAFKRDRFSLLSRHAVEYFRPGVSLLDRDNVGLILLLRPAGSADQSQPSCLCVANTHLLYNPRRGDIKLAQTALLLAEIRRLAQLPDGTPCPVVLCGDLNSVPWSPLYSFLRRGTLEYEGIPTSWVSGQEEHPRGHRVLSAPIWPPSLGISQRCQYETQSSTDPAAVRQPPASPPASPLASPPRIEHSLLLSSAYSHMVRDGRPEITTSHSRTSITVDYILYTPAVGDVATHTEHSQADPLPDGRGLHLLGRLGLVSQSELMKVNGLPNEHHSSDHLPLLARFSLCP